MSSVCHSYVIPMWLVCGFTMVRNEYVSNTTSLNKLNKYFWNWFWNIPVRTTSHALTHKWALPRTTWFSILPWKASNSAAVYSVKCTYQLYLFTELSLILKLNFWEINGNCLLREENLKEFFEVWITRNKNNFGNWYRDFFLLDNQQ